MRRTAVVFVLTGLIVGFGGPIMGALADTAGRRMPWIVAFSAMLSTQSSGKNMCISAGASVPGAR